MADLAVFNLEQSLVAEGRGTNFAGTGLQREGSKVQCNGQAIESSFGNYTK